MNTAAAFFVAVLSVPALSQVDLIQNGDFEIGPPIPVGWSQLTFIGNELPGWSVAFGNIDYCSEFWVPSSGRRSIDLHGWSRGAIEQSVPTTPGVTYEVVFDLGATGGTWGCFVSAAGQTSPTFTHAGGTFPLVTWALDRRWSFIANATSTAIRIDSSAPGDAGGAHIDNVRLYGVSFPASFQTFGVGCPGSAGTPVLDALPGSRPVLGQEFTVELTQLPISLADAVFLLIGVDSAAPPTPLDPIGMPGCSLHIVPIDAYPLIKFNGAARWRVTPPLDHSLVTVELVVQAFAFDRGPAPNPLGATTSNAARMILGNQ